MQALVSARARAFSIWSSWLDRKGNSHGMVRNHCAARRWLAYLFGLSIFLLSGYASAAFPTVAGYRITSPFQGSAVFNGSSRAGVCTSFAAYLNTLSFIAGKPVSGTINASNNCQISGPTGGGFQIQQIATCPTGATLTGGQCICSAAYVEINNQCTPIADRCKNTYAWESQVNGRLGGTGIRGRYEGNLSSGEQRCFEFTDNNPTNGGKHYCSLQFNKEIGWEANGQAYTRGTWNVPGGGGGACTPSSNPNDKPNNPVPPEPPCPAGQIQGTVNGQTVCHKPAPDQVNQNDKPTTTTQTETRDNGDGTSTTTTTSTTTQTTCTGTSCNTVTNTTVNHHTTDNSTGDTINNTTTNSSTGSQNPIGEFCKSNPKSPICGDGGDGEKSAFGGTCSAGFECSGDAIQCAIAKDQHRRHCQVFEAQGTQEENLYDAAKGKTGTQTGDNPNNQEINASAVLGTTDLLGGSSSGVSDMTVTVSGRNITLPFSKINYWLGVLGNIMVAVSFILAFRIVSRG